MEMLINLILCSAGSRATRPTNRKMQFALVIITAEIRTSFSHTFQFNKIFDIITSPFSNNNACIDMREGKEKGGPT